ncbi:type I-E CRISPR-associated protein Cas5/CasD [Saccharopolyspora hordei]|uniref:CRISPR system Cascade subunit CasD n=1 Tax=Saccharopolyspora hordei TaxID=1838 RepID=A0A853AR13_9PSEU|nr:type I-E CRISPR-associated protein Cas5/CasD [Saccharopolyspora hordei]NYI83560.1 CRISPR system Cascade subunit CasD [Saccharopolyspora hordei]
MTHTLALCLDAPMQSWGLRSRFQSRDTAQEPTKSGIVGLLAAALGIPRHDTDSIRRLATVRMGVRADREGIVERDFHTVNNVPNTEGKKHRTILSQRYYLADALFLVVLEHPDREELVRWHTALHRPRWPLYFGRRAFVPARPLVAPHPDDECLGIADRSLEATLEGHCWLENRSDLRERARRALAEGQEHLLRTLIDTDPTDELAEPRQDVPQSFHPRNRLFTSRSVRTGHVPLTTALIHSGAHPCT